MNPSHVGLLQVQVVLKVATISVRKYPSLKMWIHYFGTLVCLCHFSSFPLILCPCDILSQPQSLCLLSRNLLGMLVVHVRNPIIVTASTKGDSYHRKGDLFAPARCIFIPTYGENRHVQCQVPEAKTSPHCPSSSCSTPICFGETQLSTFCPLPAPRPPRLKSVRSSVRHDLGIPRSIPGNIGNPPLKNTSCWYRIYSRGGNLKLSYQNQFRKCVWIRTSLGPTDWFWMIISADLEVESSVLYLDHRNGR